MTEPYYDHALSPRLGQPTPVENPGVQLHTIETSPEVAYRGQIIYLIDIDQFRVFDGVAWQIPSGSSNAAGLQMFVGSTAPVADATGDLWMNNATNQLSVWDGTVWRPTVDPAAAAANTAASNAMAAAIQAQDAAQLARAAADGKITTYYSSTQPTTGSLGDLWINTVTNRLYRYNGGWGTE